mmetsp:Transcript_94394/g.173041  ORF Transcript_94394/g.173041 Transcript_94394/m.173041 type:complete len:89 (+) Transcript_94394:452-718(+)
MRSKDLLSMSISEGAGLLVGFCHCQHWLATSNFFSRALPMNHGRKHKGECVAFTCSYKFSSVKSKMQRQIKCALAGVMQGANFGIISL